MTTSTSSTSASTPERPPFGRLARIVVTVPDPQATGAFLSNGLHFTVIEDAGHLIATCEGDYATPDGQGAIELVPGDDHRMERLVFGMPDAADLDELAALIGARRASDTAIHVNDPTGLTVAFEAESRLRVPAPPPSVLRPRRMGHVNLKSSNPPVSAKFFTQTLDLRLSEYIGESLYWLRTDTEHHNVALRPGTTGTAHHLGFEVPGWQAYQPLLDHLDSEGYKIEYGPGRHRPGRSLFVYVCDPSSGMRLELFADMAHINDPDAVPIGWEAGDRMTKTLNTWGPTPPQSFLE
ncbi:VOC family protein [Streptomyces sp. NPDC050560]|uniref:VOC family protein n=1 Tax=Streptomyces sp. NPDC050560 TaxID=3365630 RepID=UPI00379DE9FC